MCSIPPSARSRRSPPRSGRPSRDPGEAMITRVAPRGLPALLALTLWLAAPAAAQPSGTMTWGVHVTLATKWLDPAEVEADITPFMIHYALHDALVKPMPGNLNTPSLAESWTMSKDGRTWEFVLRKNTRFHNGDPVTAEDVKFSFERYRGAAATLFKDRVREVQVVDPGRVRFHLKDPWPDFMTFYGTSASGAGWIVPKKYVEKVGEDGYRRAPIGAGPYKFVSFQPGVELVLEAFDGYWRKTPSVKRLVLRSVPDAATRAAALTRGAIDVTYLLNAPAAVGIRTRLRTMERAALLSAWRDHKLRGVFVGATGSAGNASTRLEAFATSKGGFTYGTIPEVESLFARQIQEMDRKKREEMLHQIQRILADRVTFAPIWENGFIRAFGPRVEESGLTLIQSFPYSAPLEDVRLKKQ